MALTLDAFVANPAQVVTVWAQRLLARADGSVHKLKLALARKESRDALVVQAGIAVGALLVVGGVVYTYRALTSSRATDAATPVAAPEALGAAKLKPALEMSKYEKQMLGDMVDQAELSQDFDDIGGLDDTIRQIEELVIYPLSHPHLYQHSAVAQQPTGLLLYGPPGTGKTLLAKAIAKTARASFINVNVAHIQSKWFGETPKLVEAIFSLARKVSPCVVFVDEIDGVLSARNDMDMQHVNTMKTKFMECWDGLTTPCVSKAVSAGGGAEAASSPKEAGRDWVLVIGATNKPWALDPAVLRRMPRQLYVGLPDTAGRASILRVLLRHERVSDALDVRPAAEATEGYSGSDLKELVRAAALIPIREAVAAERTAAKAAKARGEKHPGSIGATARPLHAHDLHLALDSVKPTGVAAHAYKHRQAAGVTGFGVPSGPGARGGSSSSRPSGRGGAAADPDTAPAYAPTASLRLNSMQLTSAVEGVSSAPAPTQAHAALRSRAHNHPSIGSHGGGKGSDLSASTGVGGAAPLTSSRVQAGPASAMKQRPAQKDMASSAIRIGGAVSVFAGL